MKSIRRAVLVACVAAALPAAAQSLTAINGAKFASFPWEPEERIVNFRSWETLYPVAVVHRSGEAFHFKEKPVELPVSFTHNGNTRTLAEWLDETTTTNFLVVKDDTIVYEQYFRGNTKDSKATSMSVAKSFTSAMVGLCVADGLIASIDDPITKYVDFLKGSGYDGVPIRHILEMSSGIKFNEKYDDNKSDIMVMVGSVSVGKSIKDYAKALVNEKPSGTDFNYASIDTNILGFLIEAVTKKSPAQFLEERIWGPLGMESDAFWGMDNRGNVLTFMGLNVTARDYAKFGRLYLNKGNWNGKQIIPAQWVADSTQVEKDYLKLIDEYWKGWDIGYGYQWWIPAGNEGEFTAIGVWGQYIYVNPTKKLIIVKNSVDPGFDLRDMETVAAFRAIGDYLTSKK
jgi:CubicO group peptidase (beta-lactamase class C family)